MGSEHPEWLPLDWKVSVKIRNFGRKDKYYIHTSTGLTFNSKPEVLRYLRSSRKSSNPKVMNKMQIRKTVAENLPPGWMKEIRTKKKEGKIRRDPYYIDPVTGRQFRSMQEVFRYLESNNSHSGKTESKPDDKGHTSTEFVDNSRSSPAEAKGHRSIAKRGDKTVTVGDSIKSGPEATAPKNVEKPPVEERRREEDSVAEKLQNKQPRAPQNGGRRQSMRLANNKLKDDAEDLSLKSGSESGAGNNMNVPEGKGLEQREKENGCMHENPAPRKERKSTKRKWMNNLPRRTSKRLGSLGVDRSVEDKDGASARQSGEGEVDSTKNAGTSGQSNENPETDTSAKSCTTEQCRAENPSKDEQKESMTEEQKSVEGVVSHEDQKHVDSCLKELLMDPCIEFAIKTLTGAIPIEDVNKSCNQTWGCSPSGDIWSDPCFEFAVKTLTGEMPPEVGLQAQMSSPSASANKA